MNTKNSTNGSKNRSSQASSGSLLPEPSPSRGSQATPSLPARSPENGLDAPIQLHSQSDQQAQLPVNYVSRSQEIEEFDQPVVLRQSPFWAQLIIWLIILSTGGIISWAALFEIDEAISASGKLEPQDAVKSVQVPAGGVIQQVFVEEGQPVQAGEVLLSLDPTASEADLEALRAVYQSLLEETQLLQAQRQGLSQDPTLSLEKQALLQARQAEFQSRVAAAKAEIEELEQQREQNEVTLANAQALLEVDQEILADILPLYEAGGLSKMQYLSQEQQVRQRQAEIDFALGERKRQQAAIQQAQQRLDNTMAQTQQEILAQIVENQKQIAEMENQLKQVGLARQYQELRAPIGGTIFDLQADTPGDVVTPNVPVLKIVPPNPLVAEVFLTNRDIGFVEVGMPVDIQIDSFPFGEFGDVKGEVVWIGSDVLEPDQIYSFYRFPAQIQLEQQYLTVRGQQVLLKSGMSVRANIRTRKRTVLNIFIDKFTRNVESLRFVR